MTNFVKLEEVQYRTEAGAFGDVPADVVVLLRQRHDQQDGVARVMTDDAVAMQEVDQDGKDEEPGTAPAVGVGVDVEKDLQQVGVVLLHETGAQQVQYHHLRDKKRTSKMMLKQVFQISFINPTSFLHSANKI